MSDLRPMVDDNQVLALLNQHFMDPITNLTAVEGGQVARTFAFRVTEQEYIVRFHRDNMMTSNFPKEEYVYRKLASTRVPMPPLLQVGRLGELHFAISQKMPGKMVEQHTPQEVEQLMPQLMDILDAIHMVDVSDTEGYGTFDYLGEGMASSWHGYLLRVAQEEDERDYFGKWHHLFADTFLERNFFEDIYRHMQSLLQYCPSERFLLHGNYSLRNILAQNGKITAVLDWIDAKYGDFMYDLAPFDFWYPWLHIAERFQQYYQERKREVPFFEERLLCYQCYHALDGLRFFAASSNEQSYQFTRSIILQKLKAFAP